MGKRVKRISRKNSLNRVIKRRKTMKRKRTMKRKKTMKSMKRKKTIRRKEICRGNKMKGGVFPSRKPKVKDNIKQYIQARNNWAKDSFFVENNDGTIDPIGMALDLQWMWECQKTVVKKKNLKNLEEWENCAKDLHIEWKNVKNYAKIFSEIYNEKGPETDNPYQYIDDAKVTQWKDAMEKGAD